MAQETESPSKERATVRLRTTGSTDLDEDYLARELTLRLPSGVSILLNDEDLPAESNDTVLEVIADSTQTGEMDIEIAIQKKQAAPMSRILQLPDADESVLLIAQAAAELLLSNPNYLLARPDPLPEPDFPPIEETPPEPEEIEPEEAETPEKRWTGWFEVGGWGGYSGNEGYAHGTLSASVGATMPKGFLFGLQVEYDFPVEFEESGQRFELHSIPLMARFGWHFSLSKVVRLVPFVAFGDRMHLVVFRPETGNSSHSVDHCIAGSAGINLRIHFHENGYVLMGSRVELRGQQRHLLNDREVFTTGTWRVDGGLGLGLSLP